MSGKQSFGRGLVWLRNDLRLHDNTALYRAARCCDELAAVFIACPETWRSQDEGEPLVSFRLGCLQELGEGLAARNIPLYFLELRNFSQVPKALRQIVEKLGATAVFANAEYPLNERRRDEAVREALEEVEVAVEYCTDRTLVAPGAVTTNSGDAYKVFTPFKRAFISDFGGDSYEPLPAPRKRSADVDWPAWLEVEGANNLVQTIPDELRGYQLDLLRDGEVLGWRVGEQAGRRRLRRFADSIDDYEDQRDLPAIDGTSRLSPYLNSGAISVRQCAHMALGENDGRWAEGSEGITCWLGELVWREFYTHLLEAHPRLCKHEPFKTETDKISWSTDRDAFNRWASGETGVPIVDAAMRQLQQTGWMHNRLRMVVASFLTKNLLIDWRWGERHFMQHLVDADFASNNGGWQWAASTGTDAVPYFRVFNPYSQSEKYDRDGKFIRKYVPELKNLEGKQVHCPPEDADYPSPMCDVKETRKRAIEAFADLK